MHAIILAAGYATRLYPLTKDQPKPLLKIGPKTILDYLLERIHQIPAIDNVHIVTNAQFFPIFQQWTDTVNAQGKYSHFYIHVIDDGTRSNETRLGAIADVQYVIQKHQIDDDLLVAAGDNIFTFDFFKFYQFWLKKKADVVAAQELLDHSRLKQRGVVEFDDRFLVVGFEEKPQKPRSTFVCPALYLHQKMSLPLYQRYLAQGGNPDAPGHFITWLYRQMPIYAFVFQEESYDIGTLETYHQVCERLQSDS